MKGHFVILILSPGGIEMVIRCRIIQNDQPCPIREKEIGTLYKGIYGKWKKKINVFQTNKYMAILRKTDNHQLFNLMMLILCCYPQSETLMPQAVISNTARRYQSLVGMNNFTI